MPIEAYKSDHLYRPVKPLPAETLEFFAPKKTQSLYTKRMEELAVLNTKVPESPSIEVPEIVLDLAPTIIEEDDDEIEVQINAEPEIEVEKIPDIQHQEVVRIMQMVSISYFTNLTVIKRLILGKANN